jgi:hypothetical protein
MRYRQLPVWANGTVSNEALCKTAIFFLRIKTPQVCDVPKLRVYVKRITRPAVGIWREPPSS